LEVGKALREAKYAVGDREVEVREPPIGRKAKFSVGEM
jgi:hypothetical protein